MRIMFSGAVVYAADVYGDEIIFSCLVFLIQNLC